MGISVEERKISIDEALESGKEAFVTGTAAGVSHIESITHGVKTKKYAGGEPGELTVALRKKLKGIQYGVEEDSFGWMVEV
jgi:branched-chain amino acid aminotransferase